MKRGIFAAVVGVFALVGLVLSLRGAGSEKIGFVNSERLMEEYVKARVQESLQAEIHRLQEELDAQIAKTAGLSAEERISAIEKLKKQYQSQLDEAKAALVEPRISEVKKAIETVADKHGVIAVLDNASQTVLYGGLDLTNAVLEELAG